MSETPNGIYRLGPSWVNKTAHAKDLQLVDSASDLQSFILNITQFPMELTAQLFNALGSKTNLTSLTVLLASGAPSNNNDDKQTEFDDYFCDFFRTRGKQLEKLTFNNARMKIELLQKLVHIATTSMTSLSTLILSNFVDVNFASALSPAVLKLYASWISRSNLTEFRITESQLSSNDIMILTEGLAKNNSITKLILTKNQIGDSGALALATGLESNSSITWLDLSLNKIGDNGASSLSSLLKRNHSLKRLDLTGNHITIAGVQHLAFGLKTNKGLAELYVDTPPSRMDRDAMASLCPSIKLFQFNSTLKHLALNDFQIHDSAALLDLVAKNTSLTALDLTRVKVLDWTALANVLRTNKTLLSLNLNGAKTTPDGSDSRDEFLRALGESNLTRVNLSHAKLQDDGSAVLSEALMGNKRLQSLDLSHNDMRKLGVLSWTNVLAANTTLLELNLSNNNLERCDGLFEVLLEQNTTLTSLSMRSCNLGGRSLRIVCDIVATKQNLHELDMTDNWQLANIRLQLATALQNNKFLVKCLADFQSLPQIMVQAVTGVPQLMHIVEKVHESVLRHSYSMTACQSIWLAKKRFKTHVRALRAAQIVLLAPDRGTLGCLPKEILELVFASMAGHALSATDFLVKFAKQRERLKYERALTNKVDFLREYLRYRQYNT